jgi:peptidyl-prolyl cis-trans isomerase A (cyclophilin A)
MKTNPSFPYSVVLGAFAACILPACGQEKKTEAPRAAAVIEKAGDVSALLDPAKLTAKAPDSFKVKFETTKGSFTIEVTRAWAPNGADRFFNLVSAGFFKDIAFFRAIDGFMAQFGIHGDPKVSTAWREARIPDDPTGQQSNLPGFLTFATSGPNSRTTQMFINFGNNAGLDSQGFPPIGRVIEGMDVVKKLNTEYGEGAPSGRGPNQGQVQGQGNAYLKASFPNLDYIKSATVLK